MPESLTRVIKREADWRFKYVVLGDSNSGKSCLVQQFMDQMFRSVHDVTVGADYHDKVIKVANGTVKLCLWDTAGAEVFRSLTNSYYRGATAVFLVYDVTRRETFKNVPGWLEDCRTRSENRNLTVMLVGNKADLDEIRQVSSEEGAAFAKENGLLFMETSARTSKNIEEAFAETTDTILKKIADGVLEGSSLQLSSGIHLRPSKPKFSQWKCCAG